MAVVDLDFRIFLRHLMEGALPEIEHIGQHIGLAAERQLAGLAGSNVFFGKPAPRILPGMTFFRKLKRKFQAAVNLCTGIDHFLNRDFIRRPFSGNAAHAGIYVAGVLAHDDIVDVFRRLVGKGSLHARIQFHGAQIDILVKIEPEFQEDSFLKNAGGNVGTSDRAEINRAVFLQNFRCVVGHDGALFHITCSTPVISIEFHCETEFPGCGLENLYTFIDDFRACSVAGKTSDLVSFYCHFSILGLKIKNLLI